MLEMYVICYNNLCIVDYNNHICSGDGNEHNIHSYLRNDCFVKHFANFHIFWMTRLDVSKLFDPVCDVCHTCISCRVVEIAASCGPRWCSGQLPYTIHSAGKWSTAVPHTSCVLPLSTHTHVVVPLVVVDGITVGFAVDVHPCLL